MKLEIRTLQPVYVKIRVCSGTYADCHMAESFYDMAEKLSVI